MDRKEKWRGSGSTPYGAHILEHHTRTLTRQNAHASQPSRKASMIQRCCMIGGTAHHNVMALRTTLRYVSGLQARKPPRLTAR